MDAFKSFKSQIYDVNDQSFENIAIELFRFQAIHNPIYRSYIRNLGINIESVQTLTQIPFLPIAFFKHHTIKTGNWLPEEEFASSGTTGSIASKHLIRDSSFYRMHSQLCFEYFFGDLSGFHFLALLPSYLERKNSSLVAMIRHFIQCSHSKYSGFYLDYDKLLKNIEVLRAEGDRKIIVWGVSFALLDFAESSKPNLSDCLVFETGGMKGRRNEITRQELHEILKDAFQISSIFSEYGMTEMLSQAYTKGDQYFFCPKSMKVLVREVTDPFEKGIMSVGGLNIIDLANFHSIAFIETEDLGKVCENGSFEVLGRIDNSDVRGCNLLANR